MRPPVVCVSSRALNGALELRVACSGAFATSRWPVNWMVSLSAR